MPIFPRRAGEDERQENVESSVAGRRLASSNKNLRTRKATAFLIICYLSLQPGVAIKQKVIRPERAESFESVEIIHKHLPEGDMRYFLMDHALNSAKDTVGFQVKDSLLDAE